MTPNISSAVHDWHSPVSSELATHALDALEAGSVLRLPLPFTLSADEQSLLSPELLSGARKNISYNPTNARLQGADGDAALEARRQGFLMRYHASARPLIGPLFAPYRCHLLDGRAS